MRLSPVIAQIKAQCHDFKGNVAGALDWDPAKESVLMKPPAALVIPTGDAADEPESQNVITQEIRDAFDICVVLKNHDERGQAVADQLHHVRAALWRALVGFTPDEEYGVLLYDGGGLLLLDRDRVVYRFRFYADYQLGNLELDNNNPETWQGRVLAGLPDLEGIDTRFDFINPLKDSNVTAPGPDGRVEFTTRENLTP